MKATREGKPYCTLHVERHPYVARLLVEIEQREAEIAVLSRWRSRRPHPTSFLVSELVRALTYESEGAATVPKLARDLQLDSSVIRRIARVAKSEGLVKLGKNGRGYMTVHVLGSLQRLESA